MFDKMQGKKKPMMNEVEKSAKMSVLEQMKALAEQAMGDKVKGMKKVTVAGDSPEALEEGLDTAKEMMSPAEGSTLDDMMADHDEDAHEDMEAMSEDELDAKIQELMAKKEKMKLPRV